MALKRFKMRLCSVVSIIIVVQVRKKAALVISRSSAFCRDDVLHTLGHAASLVNIDTSEDRNDENDDTDDEHEERRRRGAS